MCLTDENKKLLSLEVLDKAVLELRSISNDLGQTPPPPPPPVGYRVKRVCLIKLPESLADKLSIKLAVATCATFLLAQIIQHFFLMLQGL